MSPRVYLAATALLLASGGCMAKRSKPEAVEVPAYTFPHSVHVDAGLECTACHQGITQATRIGPDVVVALPSGDAAESCLACHEKVPDAPPARPANPTITFSHATHLPMVQDDCKRCHTQLVEPGMERAPVPAMSTCTSCHNHAEDYAQARCQPCHVDLKRYPLKPISDFKHEANFLRAHGQMAKSDAATCAACHEQTSCAECHAAATRPVKPDVQWPEKVGASFIHRGDFVSRHRIEARADPASCRKCHGSASCNACHLERGISPSGVADPHTNPHPAGWNAGLVHGPAARQDIASCAACHDQGARSTCVSCHRSVDPHPPGWARSHNKTSDVAKNSMCRTCHAQ